MAVQLQIVCADNQQVSIELKITEPALEEPAAVQPYEEPALFSPVKRNAISISLAGEEGGSVTAEEVHGMFSFAGTIESFEVHEKGQSAVVTYSDEQAANTAMLLNESFLAGSPVCVSALIAESAEAEVCSPPPRFARLSEQEEEDELLLFSPTQPGRLQQAASESELAYARAALHRMAAAGYTLGARALSFIAMVDSKYGPSIRQSASELSQAASEMVAPVSEKIVEYAGHYTSSLARNTTARQLSSATYATYATSVDVASSVVSQTSEVASLVAGGVSQVATQVRELDAEHGISHGISTGLRAGAATAMATARDTAQSAPEYAAAAQTAAAQAAAAIPSLTPLKKGLGQGVEKGRVLANIALAKGQRIFFSCPSPAKAPSKARTPSRPSVLSAECHLADTLEPTYA